MQDSCVRRRRTTRAKLMILLCLIALPAVAPPVSAQPSAPVVDKDSLLEDAVPRAMTSARLSREQKLEQEVRVLKDRLTALEARVGANKVKANARESLQQGTSANDHIDRDEAGPANSALQKRSPGLTLLGDVLATLILKRDSHYASEFDRSEMPIRSLGLHFHHTLDPYSAFSGAVHVSPRHGVDLEEAYVTWFRVLPNLSLNVGRFRQGFGVVNRWHEHDLDQTHYPMALEAVLGADGLVGNGISARWTMPPLWAHAQQLVVEVVDGRNETLFSGEHFSVPSAAVRLKSHYDINATTHFDLGLSGMFGANNRRGFLSNDKLVDEPWRRTMVAGADLTLFWSGSKQAPSNAFTWRSEFYYAYKEQAQPRSPQAEHSWGCYSYLQQQVLARFVLGVRGDIALATVRDSDLVSADVAPYITFLQSDSVFLRAEYRHTKNVPNLPSSMATFGRTDDRLLFQVNVVAGPHPPEDH